MATKNPRVVGYIQPENHALLRQFIDKHDVSESKALDLILGEYFEIDVPRVTRSSIHELDSKIDAALTPLKAELEEIKAQLRAVHGGVNCHSQQQEESGLVAEVERLKAELSEVTAARDDFFDSWHRDAKRIRELEAQGNGLTSEKCDRILVALGVGKQSPQYKRVKAVLDQMMS